MRIDTMTKIIKVALGFSCCALAMTNCWFAQAAERGLFDLSAPDNIDMAKQQIMNALSDLKKLVQTRAPRLDGISNEDGSLSVSSCVDGTFLEQIKCILCKLTAVIGEVDYEGTWAKLLEEISCEHAKHPEIPQDYAAVAAVVAKALTEILQRIGCSECENELLPPDVLGALCYISSQIDVLEEHAQTIQSKVFLMNSEINIIDSKIDTIESNISACCSVIGTPNETIDCSFIDNLTTCDQINGTDLSIIQWLKAIFLKCQ